MLTKTQKEYLLNLPRERLSMRVEVYPWDPKSKQIAQSIASEIRFYTGEDLVHMGSSALEIAGEHEIDLYIFKKEANLELINKITNILNCQAVKNKWRFYRDSFKVSLKIVDPEEEKRKEQRLFFEELKSNPLLRQKYESIKIANCESFEKYTLAKMDFVTRVVNFFNKENQKRLRKLIDSKCAVEKDHVFISPSLHASQSFDIEKFLDNESLVTDTLETLEKEMGIDFDLIVGIPRHGDILGMYIAKNKNKRFIASTNLPESLNQEKIMIFDDTVVTGKTIIEVINEVKGRGGLVIGTAVICSRKNIPDILFERKELNFHTYVIQDDYLFGYSSEECPYCKSEVAFSKEYGFWN